jgi:TfoX/Sxy family transcriptional regulator of competence genes
MAYDETLGGRVRAALASQPAVTERKMFGGLAFMVTGNMACGVIGEDLMVRVGPEAHDEALAEPHTRVMDFTHRPIKGMIYVAPAGVAAIDDLERWVRRGAAFARSLPPK